MHIYVENVMNEEGKRKAHTIPEATLLILCWGKTELLPYAKHCPKRYPASASQKPWEAGTSIAPVFPVRRVRHREIKGGALAHRRGMSWDSRRQATPPGCVRPCRDLAVFICACMSLRTLARIQMLSGRWRPLTTCSGCQQTAVRALFRPTAPCVKAGQWPGV